MLIFKRLSNSNKFNPTIDGLRFIAIISVLLFHIIGFLNNKLTGNAVFVDYTTLLGRFALNASCGVELFFAISGFILATPLFRDNIKSINRAFYKAYVIRRISRIEPPYLIAMTILFIVAIAINTTQLQDYFWSWIASLLYSHNIVFGRPSILNTVAWTLEIELQYYLIAPLLVIGYNRIKLVRTRRLIIFALIILISFIEPYRNLIPSVLSYGHFFLVGVLIADIYASAQVKSTPWAAVAFASSILGLYYCGFKDSSGHAIVFSILLMTALYSALLLNGAHLKFLNNKFVYLIGGMCYSIYLLHYPLISLFGNPLVGFGLPPIIIASVLLLSSIIISTAFYLVIEKPTMYYRWYKHKPRSLYKLVYGF